MEVDFLVEAVKLTALVKGFELAVAPHSLLLGLDHRRGGTGAADAQVAAG